MQILFIISGSYIAATLTISILALLYRTSSGRKYLISQDPKRAKGNHALYRSIIVSSSVSMATVFVILFGFTKYLVHNNDTPIWVMAIKAVTVIIFYDFLYYAMHRFLFHGWTPLKKVHAVHHSVKHPRVIDSLMLHPIEAVMGLTLFFGTVALIGGVHIYTLSVLFMTYTILMILNHSGVNCPRFPFRILGVLAKKHDQHHHGMSRGNYAAVTPLPDIVFKTVEKKQ